MIPPPLLRRIKLTALTLLATLAALAGVVLSGAPVEGTVPSPRVPRRIPFTDVHPYGANFFLEREADPWTQAKTVELAREGGIRWAKQHFIWSEIESVPGAFEWSKYDHIVDLYRAHGLEVVGRLDWPPAWVKATPGDYKPGQNNLPDRFGDYARFVGQTVAHFRGRVRFYQIWNEPNLLAEWGNRLDQPVDPAAYVDLLAAASRAAKAADPNVVILSAPLAINTETIEVAGNLNDLDFLDGLYAAGAAEHFDVMSANAFGMDRPPADPPATDVLNFRRVELQRRTMAARRDGDKPVWFAEFGWNSAPERLGAKRLLWRRVDEEQQAAWTVEGVRWAREHWPWSGVFFIWYFRQWGGKTPDEADYYFRMVDPDFTPRRLYEAVRADARSLAVAGPGEWAERSSPVDLADMDDWRWVGDDGAQDRNVLIAARPGAALTFRFEGSAIEARAGRGPAAGALEVTVDGRRGGADGEGEVSLAAPGDGWNWTLLADGLADGEHELRLVAVGEGRVAIDGFRVVAGPSGSWREHLPLFLAAMAAALATLLAVDARRAARRVRW